MRRRPRLGAVRAAVLAALPLLCAAAALPAQALRTERRAYARMQELRLELGELLRGADDALRRSVAARLAERSSGNPFADLAAATALARGIEDDEALRLRAGLLVIALPEVVDPEVVDTLHVTVHAPRIVPDPGVVSFDVALVRADAGADEKPLRQAVIDGATETEDLLRFRATTTLDVADLPDGRYRVIVHSRIDGELASPDAAVPLSAPIVVLAGFKARADALPMVADATPERLDHADAIAAQIPERRRDADSRAILTAALWQVERVYLAEPTVPGADPVADLERAEAILANLLADRPALAGLAGRMTIGFPLTAANPATAEAESPGDSPRVGAISIDLGPAERNAAEPRPFVLVVPGAPSWNRDAGRPMSPRSLAPDWALAALRGPAARAPRELVVIESPGRYPSATRAVADAVAFVRRLFPAEQGSLCLVGEREGGYAVARTALADPRAFAGVVLAAGGGFSAAEVERLGDLPVLVIPAAGHPSTPILEWLGGLGRDSIRALPADGVAWPMVLAGERRRILDFTTDIAGR